MSGKNNKMCAEQSRASTHHSCLQSGGPSIFDLHNETRLLNNAVERSLE